MENQIKTYKLTKVTRFTTNKEGQPLKTKDGRPYTSVRIQVAEYGQSWISGFGNAQNNSWKEGDDAELIIEKKGEYLNFSMPKPVDKQNELNEKILNKLTQMNLLLSAIHEHVVPKKQGAVKMPEGVDYPEEDLGQEDINSF
jgi:hypothetical protein